MYFYLSGCGGSMRVLVANDPPTYRKVFTDALRLRRPGVEVLMLEPGDLDRQILGLGADMVICSSLSETVLTRCRAWILLYPNGESWAEIGYDGSRVILEEIQLEDILSLVDRTEESVK